jgi:hypothetical protein
LEQQSRGENESLFEIILGCFVGGESSIDGRQQKTSAGLSRHFVSKIVRLLPKKDMMRQCWLSKSFTHIAVDTQGVPHAIHSDKLISLKRRCSCHFKSASSSLSNVVNVLADGGITHEIFADLLEKL